MIVYYKYNRGEQMRKKDDEKEKSIKEAVIKLILQEGFHGTSISKIAKEAGVSPATVYIYYENKEVMLQDIYREYSEEIFDYILSKIKKGMGGQQLIEILVRSILYLYSRKWRNFSFCRSIFKLSALASQCSEHKGHRVI